MQSLRNLVGRHSIDAHLSFLLLLDWLWKICKEKWRVDHQASKRHIKQMARQQGDEALENNLKKSGMVRFNQYENASVKEDDAVYIFLL